jgi:hypothetical protein
MADASRSAREIGQLSEAQVAVNRREEEKIPLPPGLAAHANAGDPAILERFRPENLPRCFEAYAALLTWDKKWNTIAGHRQPAVLAVVRRRPAERLRELRRSAPGDASGPGRADLLHQVLRARQ